MGCKNLLFTNQVASIIGNKTFTASESRTEDSARIMSQQPSYPPPPANNNRHQEFEGSHTWRLNFLNYRRWRPLKSFSEELKVYFCIL